MTKEEEKKKNDSMKEEVMRKAEKLGVAYLLNAPENIPSEIVNIIPRDVSEKYKIFSFQRESGSVSVAMVDPEDLNALNALRFISDKEKSETKIYLVSPGVFEDLFEMYSKTTEVLREAVESFKNRDDVEDAFVRKENKNKTEIETLKDAPVAKLVEVILTHAVDGKASDVHIEPMGNDYRVRFRVDGILHVSLILPLEIGPVVVSRIKIMANLKIDEKRKPQDGRFRMTVEGRQIDFRVSSLPVVEGEKVVMRILDKDEGGGKIEALGLLGLALENVKKVIHESFGMILITGPTGSGKSTTLYSALKILNDDDRNIVTLEDPVEYYIEGINQSQIKPEIGYTFASGLRTILRQDPNVIMVGEIRDAETAELAVHAALTGHLMFSTLHTNTAIGAIPRLIDMGIEPFLLSSSLRMVIAQRLVRRICENCKEEISVPESVRRKVTETLSHVSSEEFEKYGIASREDMKFYHGKGCDICGGTGLKGRLAIYEVIPVGDVMKDIIAEKRGSEELLRKERDNLGVITIEEDGLLKVIAGLTIVEEVERVTEARITLEEGVG
ncbi:MAG: type II/IV secretion system protein [Candidatus Moranbacteria bacterium]|nr:type II/IV secretion system protein [Candidatus Moranbacteria bacterium]